MNAILTHALSLRLLSVIVVCVAWEYGGRVPISPAFPTFGETMVALGGLLADGSLQQAFLIQGCSVLVMSADKPRRGMGLGR